MTPCAPASKRAGGAFHGDLGEVAGPDQVGVQIGAVERGEDGDRKDARRAARRALDRGADDLRVAVDRQEIEVVVRDAAHGGLDRGADVEQLHVEEDALALFVLQLIGEREAAAGQHPQPDLVEADGIAEPRRQGRGPGPHSARQGRRSGDHLRSWRSPFPGSGRVDPKGTGCQGATWRC